MRFHQVTCLGVLSWLVILLAWNLQRECSSPSSSSLVVHTSQGPTGSTAGHSGRNTAKQWGECTVCLISLCSEKTTCNPHPVSSYKLMLLCNLCCKVTHWFTQCLFFHQQHSEIIHSIYNQLTEKINAYQPSPATPQEQLDSPLMSVPTPAPL